MDIHGSASNMSSRGDLNKKRSAINIRNSPDKTKKKVSKVIGGHGMAIRDTKRSMLGKFAKLNDHSK